jgi:hypothetical protein
MGRKRMSLIVLYRDWKKLTFYYFADSYINFNPLVTDLFKIYKTRIWMSAINPASFATPPPSLPPGSSGLGYGQETASDRHHQHEPRGYNLPQLSTAPGSLRDPLDNQRDVVPNSIGVLRNAYVDPYQSFGPAGRQPEIGFGHIVPQNDPFSSYPSAAYGMPEPGVSDYAAANNAGSSNGQRINPTQGEWVGRFQGLSLGS